MKRIPFNYGFEDKITTETNAPFFLCSTFYFPWFFFSFGSRANNLDMCIVWKCHPNGTRYIRESMDWNRLQSDLERSNVVLLWLLFENFRAKISNFQHKISIQSTHEIHITRFSVRSNSIEFVLPDSKTVNCILVIDFRIELLFSQKTHKNSFWTKMQKRKKTNREIIISNMYSARAIICEHRTVVCHCAMQKSPNDNVKIPTDANWKTFENGR